jgi:cell wall assembly regulator SMI1
MLAGLYEEALGLELPYDMRLLYARIDGQEATAGTQNKTKYTKPGLCPLFVYLLCLLVKTKQVAISSASTASVFELLYQ